ncbi:hypothetical protein C0V82_26275 (plasmid) [Niveispirillum cyanobacteriorum]|uniref:Glycosyltransferase 2-like domain-containing protein n=1 Tax=Niveispirillum cyanobacteriorum TaxID=1612173 RepID=A0A2K9NLG9_9PROT|nr:hypothetical protein C0V82_26275 [Niveispirillum cyanobacteriorum]
MKEARTASVRKKGKAIVRDKHAHKKRRQLHALTLPRSLWRAAAQAVLRNWTGDTIRMLFTDPQPSDLARFWDCLRPFLRGRSVQIFACFSNEVKRRTVLGMLADSGMPLHGVTQTPAQFLRQSCLSLSFADISLEHPVAWHALQPVLDRIMEKGVVLARIDTVMAHPAYLVRDWPLRFLTKQSVGVLFEREGERPTVPVHPDPAQIRHWQRDPFKASATVRAEERRRSIAQRWPWRSPAVTLPASLPDGKPWPRITVVTPSYNQGAFIEETILSVLNQAYPNLEYIVVDGASTDGTGAVLERYRHRLDHCIIERDRGQSEAINKGLSRATGEIITWLNSDDMLAEGALAAVAMAFHTSGAEMVSGICVLQQDGRQIGRHMAACQDGTLPLIDLLDLDTGWLAGEFFCQPEVFFRRSLWERAGGMVREDLFYSMDYELWVRFAQVGARLHTIGRPLALFRVHADQKTFDPANYRPELTRVSGEFAKPDTPASRPVRPPVDYGHRMRFAIINDVGPRYGAGLAMARIGDSIRRAGHEAAIRAFSSTELPEKTKPHVVEAMLEWLDIYRPDCVLIGNLHRAEVDPGFIAKVAAKYATIWVAHDVWPVTGRCAYTGGCRNYRNGQGCDAACPTPEQYPSLPPDGIAPAFADKHALLTGPEAPTLLAASNWMAGFLRSAFIRKPPADRPGIETFRLGLDTARFRPVDRRTARQLLRLPEDRFIVMFGACDVNDPRKGGSHLRDALHAIRDLNPLLLAVGATPSDAVRQGLDVRATGYVASRDYLALLYSAADVFVGASIEEAFGQVFIEAAACGTPSIGYAIGGVKEAILDGVTGLLSWQIGPQHLEACLRRLHDDPDYRRALGCWARLHAENHWSLESAYRQLFGVLQRLGWVEQFDMPHRIHMPPLPY